jgi:hypothetical protein
MKRLATWLIAGALLIPVTLASAQTSTSGKKGKSAAASTTSGSTSSAKPTTLRGTVSDDGKTFVNDKNQKSWSVENPDALKGHEGHHVSVSAKVDADKNEIHVMSVKMTAQAKTKSASKKKTTS